ncbi:MAG: ABC transporter ATP-binding protein [Scytonematopsis contorta HA4267-MV1]|jgi:iron complex transport system ATP-binding protein|nr:ABC transporter ATP-binding protein [Scytonematopsis contorta HA4267-MV1]
MHSKTNQFASKNEDNQISSKIEIKLEPGEWLSIVGAKKSGKSKLLQLMAHMLLLPEDTILIERKVIKNQSASVVLQKLISLPEPYTIPAEITVRQLVDFACISCKYCKQNVEKALDLTGMRQFSEELVDNLSECERYKAFIAVALVRKPKYLLLDELTCNLDIRHQLELLEILKNLIIKKGITIVITLNDVNLALRYSSRIALLRQGVIVDLGTPESVITRSSLMSTFGVEFAIIKTPFGLPVCPLSLRN